MNPLDISADVALLAVDSIYRSCLWVHVDPTEDEWQSAQSAFTFLLIKQLLKVRGSDVKPHASFFSGLFDLVEVREWERKDVGLFAAATGDAGLGSSAHEVAR